MLNLGNRLDSVAKSTNGRSVVLWFALVLLAVPAIPSFAGPPELRPTADVTVWANESSRDHGADQRHLRRLHAAMLEADVNGESRQFSFRFVSLAREAGIPVSFFAVDAPARNAIRGTNLAAGIEYLGKVVVFDGRGVRRPDQWRLQILSDEAATAILIGEIGIEQLVNEDPAGAADQFEIALGLDPDLAWAWSGLGEALRRQGQSELAMNAYQKSLELASIRTW